MTKLILKAKRNPNRGPKREPFKLVRWETFKEMKDKVDKLQLKIALEVRNKNMERASRFAEILVRSQAAQILAVKRVVTNIGARNPGLSSRPIKSNKDYQLLLDQLRAFALKKVIYKASPLRRTYVPIHYLDSLGRLDQSQCQPI